MYVYMARDEQLHIRIKQPIKNDLKVVSDMNGLTMSSFVHSLIVRAIREEKEREPHAFSKPKGIPLAARSNNRMPAKLGTRKKQRTG